MSDSREQTEQKGGRSEVGSEEREREDGERESGVARRAGDRVVGSTKLPGSTTATFDGSNHEDAMTIQSPTSSTTRLSSIGLVAAIYLLLATREFE